jgi:hypothetical protein
MSYKQLILDTIQGKPTTRIPFVPRLDLWYRSNKYNNTLPDKYKNASLKEIVEDLGVGYHAIIPNFQDLRSSDDDLHRALGIYNLWFMPYRTVLNNVDIFSEVNGDKRTVEYRTPKGNITTETIYNAQMRSAGITITHISKYAITCAKDLEALQYIFENAAVYPNFAGYEEFKSQVGDMGVAVAYMNMAASPMHLIQRDLVPLDLFYFLTFDNPDEMALLASTIQSYFDRILDIVTLSPAEIVLSGANYDAAVTSPPFFKQHITPSLKKQARRLHAHGKFLLTHTDGENMGLLDEYIASEFDIADSICPAPMTKLSLKDVRDAFGGKITIWGGIPSISVLEDSMSDSEFFKYVDNAMTEIGVGDHIIFSIADTTPPAAKFSRIDHLNRIIKSFVVKLIV